MSKLKNPTFIVDVSETMVVSGISDSEKDYQKLYCKCGSSQSFNSKVRRKIIKNYDELTEDSLSINVVVCETCKEEYSEKNKAFLLVPNKDEIYRVDFVEEKQNDIVMLHKKKYYANYSSEKEKISLKTVIDSIKIDIKKEEIKINLNEPFEKEGLVSSFMSNKNKTEKNNIEHVLDLTNIYVLDEFFYSYDFIEYEGLEFLNSFLDKIKPNIKDLDKFKKIDFVKFLEDNSELIKEIDDDYKVNYFQLVDSGFGDGNKIKKHLVTGDYMYNLVRLYKLFFSIYSLNNASNIISTKNIKFFNSWLESKYVCNPSVYKKHNASSPSQILEISMIYDREGSLREDYLKVSESSENSGKLKISETIYNSIISINNLDTLISVYTKGIVKKSELEYLLQTYKNNRIFDLLAVVENSRKRAEDVKIDFRHIEHILKNDFDLSKSGDYLTTYIDTIRVINLLDLKEKLIFKVKNYNDLKSLHDDYSARYNAMKDAKKAEFFIKAVEPFVTHNDTIGDVEFEVVSSTERLNLEGLQMHHCIYTYLDRICDKRYLAINLTHKITKEKATAGFTRSGDKLELEQLKGFYNSRATSEMIDATLEFCKKHKFKVNSGTYDLMSDKSRQKMMPGQLSEEELFKIRKEQEDSNDNLSEEGEEEVKLKKNNFFKKFIN
jgi:hypothetical protein